MDGTIGVVLSGGGARGAYEFGALEVLAPVLDEPARMMVGTSAGALGAAYLAANVHHGLEAASRSGGEKWLEVEIGDVIGPLCSPRELARLLLYGLELLGVRAPAPPSLLDTSPQPETIAALIDFEQLARNVEDGTLATAAVVATAYATARSCGSPPRRPVATHRRSARHRLRRDRARGRARPGLQRDPVPVSGRARR